MWKTRQWESKHWRHLCFLLVLIFLGGSLPGIAFALKGEPVTTDADTVDNVYSGGISGTLWLDENADYLHDGEERAIAGYPVSLYMANDRENFVQIMVTDVDGGYEFINLKPGEYVVGVKAEENDTHYMLPNEGVSGDNKFADFFEDYMEVYSEPIEIASDMFVTGIDAAMRTAQLTVGNEPVGVTYDQQPTTIEEVQAAIDQYNAAYIAAMTSGGISAALQVAKPHWENEVAAELMPTGYRCELVEETSIAYDGFGADYNTFFLDAAATYSGGDGSQADPYLISSEANLIELGTNVKSGNNYAGRYFVLTTDIALSEVWTPIGTASLRAAANAVYNGQPFSGTFDGYYNGAYHSITNLTVSGTNSNFQGLFGYVENATIKNLTLKTSDSGVQGRLCVGGLAAYARGSTIDNCSIVGTVKSSATNSGSYVFAAGTGGLVGGSERSTIKNCDSEVTLSGAYNSGGLLGVALTGAAIENCNASGTLSSSGYYVGGLLGHVYFSNLYYPGSSSGVSITSSSADVTVTCSAHEAGGLIGKLFLPAGLTAAHMITIENCAATGNVYGTSTSSAYYGGLIGMAYAYAANVSIVIKDCFSKGNVSASSFVVGGLVGYTQGNVTLSGCYTNSDVWGGNEDVGGFIGLSDGVNSSWNGIIIENSYATGDVKSSGTNAFQAGGFIGDCYLFTTMNNCYATGNVSATYTLLSDVLYSGAGGFIGNISFGGIYLTNCYAIGNVYGGGSYICAGGLIGRIYYSNLTPAAPTIIITNCYATGSVSSSGNTNNYCGGFIGRINQILAQASLTNCYFDTTTTGTSTGVGFGSTATGTLSGLKTEEMIDLSTFPSSWSIKNNLSGKSKGSGTDDHSWYIDDDVTYPYLYFQYDGHTETETNYDIGLPVWSNTVGTITAIYDRTDFDYISGTGQFAVKTLGAARMYFPYTTDKNIFAAPNSEISVPGSLFNSSGYSKYSLGSISATDIVAFFNSPTADKISDREDRDGDGETDTYRGDTVTYDISVTNNIPSISEDDANKTIYDRLYTWRDVVITDPLADGVSFVEGRVCISYDGGSTWIDASEGTGQSQYTYDNTTGTNGALYVYLLDMAPEDEAIVKFQVIAENHAVGKSIRNKGVVEGWFYKAETGDDKYTLEMDFDDENEDPVKDSYSVTYDGNGGVTSDGKTQVGYFYPVSTAIAPTHTVKANTDTDLGFVRSSYEFTQWNSQADGNGTEYTIGEILTITEDVTFYAQWEKVKTSLTLLKTDAGDYTTPLSGAEFQLYICTDTQAGHTHTGLGDTGSCWDMVGSSVSSMESGAIKFDDLVSGAYLLFETRAPDLFQLPKGQWIINVDVSGDSITAGGTLGNADIPALRAPDEEQDADLIVGNWEKYVFPVMGGGGTFWFALTGGVLLAAGLVAGVIYRRRKSANRHTGLAGHKSGCPHAWNIRGLQRE